MNVITPGFGERRKVRKLLLYLLLAYIIINHSVRGMGRMGDTIPGSVGSINIVGMAVGSFNSFREGTGDTLMKLSGFCPRGLDQGCGQGLHALRVLLGLH